MPQFSPDQVTFGDGPGLGLWDIGHYREHQQFVQVLAGQTPAVLIPDYDFLQMLTAGNVRKSIVETHQKAHEQLSSITGVGAVDFSGFDLDKEADFYSFLGYHATSHGQLRQALGIT